VKLSQTSQFRHPAGKLHLNGEHHMVKTYTIHTGATVADIAVNGMSLSNQRDREVLRRTADTIHDLLRKGA